MSVRCITQIKSNLIFLKLRNKMILDTKRKTTSHLLDKNEIAKNCMTTTTDQPTVRPNENPIRPKSEHQSDALRWDSGRYSLLHAKLYSKHCWEMKWNRLTFAHQMQSIKVCTMYVMKRHKTKYKVHEHKMLRYSYDRMLTIHSNK